MANISLVDDYVREFFTGTNPETGRPWSMGNPIFPGIGTGTANNGEHNSNYWRDMRNMGVVGGGYGGQLHQGEDGYIEDILNAGKNYTAQQMSPLYESNSSGGAKKEDNKMANISLADGLSALAKTIMQREDNRKARLQYNKDHGLDENGNPISQTSSSSSSGDSPLGGKDSSLPYALHATSGGNNNYDLANGMQQANAQSSNPAVRAMANNNSTGNTTGDNSNDGYIAGLQRTGNNYIAQRLGSQYQGNGIGGNQNIYTGNMATDLQNANAQSSNPALRGMAQAQQQVYPTSSVNANYQQPEATYRGGIRTYDATGPNSFSATHSAVNPYNVDTSTAQYWNTPYAQQVVGLKNQYAGLQDALGRATDDNEKARILNRMETIASQANAVRDQAQANGVVLPAELRSGSNASYSDILQVKDALNQALSAQNAADYQSDPAKYQQIYQNYWQSLADSSDPMKAINNNVSAGNPINDNAGGTQTATQQMAQQNEEAQNGNSSNFMAAPATTAPAVEQTQVQQTTSEQAQNPAGMTQYQLQQTQPQQMQVQNNSQLQSKPQRKLQHREEHH